MNGLRLWWGTRLEELRAISWRLPFVATPRQLGSFIRYTDIDPDLDLLSLRVRTRLAWLARLGGVRLVDWQEIRHPQQGDDSFRDPLDLVGSVGWKAKVERPD